MADAQQVGVSAATLSPRVASSTSSSALVHALRSAAAAPNHTVDCGTSDGAPLFAHPGIMFDLRNTRKNRAQDPDPESWKDGSKAIIVTGIEVATLTQGGPCTIYTKLHPGHHETQRRRDAMALAKDGGRPCLPPRSTCEWHEVYFEAQTWKTVGSCERLAAVGRNTFKLTQPAAAAAAAAHSSESAAFVAASDRGGAEPAVAASSAVVLSAEQQEAAQLTAPRKADAPPVGEAFTVRGTPLPAALSKIALNPPIRLEPGQQRGVFIHAPDCGVAMNVVPRTSFTQTISVCRGQWGAANVKEGDTVECHNGVKRSRVALVKRVHVPVAAAGGDTANDKSAAAASDTRDPPHADSGVSVDVRYLDNNALRSRLPVAKTRKMSLMPVVQRYDDTLAVLPGQLLKSRQPFQGLADRGSAWQAAFWGRIIFREETADERSHQDRVDAAHERLRKQLVQFAAALPWFDGDGTHGDLTDDDARAYLKRRDVGQLKHDVLEICLKRMPVPDAERTKTPFTRDVPFLVATGEAALRNQLDQLARTSETAAGLVPASNPFMLRLQRCRAILTTFCRVKREVAVEVDVHVEQVLRTLDEEMAAATAAGDLFLMRKAMDKAKGTGLLDFSHPTVVRAMGTVDAAAAKRARADRNRARDEVNSALVARATERRAQAHELLLPGATAGH